VEYLHKGQSRGQKFVVVHLKNPAGHIEGLSGATKKMAQMNLESFGSPVSVLSSGLDIDFDSMADLLMRSFDNFKERQEKGSDEGDPAVGS
jgi:hypothetical protein